MKKSDKQWIINELNKVKNNHNSNLNLKWELNHIINLVNDNIGQEDSNTSWTWSVTPIQPSYYGTNIDLLTCIEKGLLEEESLKEFCRVNILKYVIRYDKKNGLEDLEKARVYLDKLIEVTDEKR